MPIDPKLGYDVSYSKRTAYIFDVNVATIGKKQGLIRKSSASPIYSAIVDRVILDHVAEESRVRNSLYRLLSTPTINRAQNE